MKKIFFILTIYAAIVFGTCIGTSWLWKELPNLNLGDEGTYRFFRGLNWFLRILPAVLLSGFSVACSRIWQKDAHKVQKRFSPAMFEKFRNVMITSLVCVLFVTANQEIFIATSNQKLLDLQNGPLELANAKETAKTLMEAGEPELAYPYALRASKICPADTEANELLTLVHNEMDLAHDRKVHKANEEKKIQSQGKKEEMPYTIRELLAKAQTAKESEDWFNTHYWASLAVKACEGTDINLPEAHSLANEAWNNLSNPSGFKNEEELDYYTKKVNAYNAFSAHNTSDTVKAYYDFLSLMSYPGRESVDPDVVRFFKLSEEELKNDYFFIEETDNIEELENNHNIYFSIKNETTGATDVYYIKGAFDTKEDDHSVRYLDGLSVISYSADGEFLRTMYAPIAKVIALPVSTLPELALKKSEIDPTWKSVPYVMLNALDRTTDGKMSTPTYSYTPTGIPLEVREKLYFSPSSQKSNSSNNEVAKHPAEETSSFIIPMPYSDFIIINNASVDPGNMDLISLMKFSEEASNYGFSYEVFMNNFVGRALYPLFILVMFIFAATIGWNYRIEGKSAFKFRWLLLVPIYSAVIYLLLEICTYLYKLINYVLIGMWGKTAIIFAFILYTLLFVIMAVNFLRHRAS